MDARYRDPTNEEINSLPPHVRRWVHDLETLVDPAGLIRDNALLKTENEQLRTSLKFGCFGRLRQFWLDNRS